MTIRRFNARDSRSALARVREDLGPDAVILSNRRVADGVEVLAASNLEAVEQAVATEDRTQWAAVNEAARDRVARDRAARDVASGAAVVRNSPAPPGAAPDGGANELGMQQLQNELANLRSLLESELHQRAWRDSAGKSSTRASLNQRLARMGFSRALGEELTDALPARGDLEKLWQRVLAALEGRLPVADNGFPGAPRVVACVGTTGVGKTSTIAKLAARAALSGGRKSVALVTMDQYRIGGQEQLETFAGHLGLPVAAVEDGPGLYAALREFRTMANIFIDTAGMSQRDPRLLDQVALLRASPVPVAICGILSASASVSQGREFILSLGRQGLSGAIITKLDEAASLGGVLDILIRTAIPVVYTCSGQRVPDDLQPAGARELVALAAACLGNRRGAGADADIRTRAAAVAG